MQKLVETLLQKAIGPAWKTTLIGYGQFLVVLGASITAAVDDDPETEPNWELVFISGATAVGLRAAEDEPSKEE